MAYICYLPMTGINWRTISLTCLTLTSTVLFEAKMKTTITTRFVKYPFIYSAIGLIKGPGSDQKFLLPEGTSWPVLYQPF